MAMSPARMPPPRYHGQTTCSSPSCRLDLAHEALLAEMRRLRGAQWTPQAAERLRGGSADEPAQAAAVSRALDAERERLRRHTRRMSDLEDDPTPEQIAAFREVSAEISARIRGLEERLATLNVRASALPDLRALHDRLTTMELSTLVDALWKRGGVPALRDLLLELVDAAHVVEHQPRAPKFLAAPARHLDGRGAGAPGRGLADAGCAPAPAALADATRTGAGTLAQEARQGSALPCLTSAYIIALTSSSRTAS